MADTIENHIKPEAFLYFSLGPVQSYIEAARSARDLWTGSYLLSWLTYQSMEPVLQLHGREAFVFPAMDQNPLWRFYKAERKYGADEQQHKKQILLPCLPNKFLVELPDAASAETLAEGCRESCNTAWDTLHAKVRESLDQELKDVANKSREAELGYLLDGWADHWDKQCDSFFDVRTSVLRFDECDDELIAKLLPEASENGRRERWVKLWDLSGRLLQASRSVRHFPNYSIESSVDVPHKCSLLGTYEQMGPVVVSESKLFWRGFSEEIRIHGTRTDRTERLSAISLVKRFAWPVFFADKTELDLNPRARRSRDTATTAAIQWLADGDAIDWENERDWSGQWLHWRTRDEGTQRVEELPSPVMWKQIQSMKREQGAPPTYYAILMLDGDEMGKWLRGEGKYSRGPQGRKRHEAISKAVSKFALERVPVIVEDEHQGQLIYAGGDDVLAMLPTANALGCVQKLSEAFREIWPDELRDTNDEKATVSAGVAVVHYKEDLRFALKAARSAEKRAKGSGRNAVSLTICRRSGAHTTAVCGWDFVPMLQEWVGKFVGSENKPGASDRWAYHLAGEVPTLRALPKEAMEAELRRQVSRGDSNGEPFFSADKVAGAFDNYWKFTTQGKRLPKETDFYRKFTDEALQQIELTGRALENFVTLCLSASFLARGRKE